MIEAHYLFGVGYDDIDIVVHPQSIVHSAIETSDSSVSARPARQPQPSGARPTRPVRQPPALGASVHWRKRRSERRLHAVPQASRRAHSFPLRPPRSPALSQVIAQLGWPDMRLPILYAMSWPHRIKVDYGRGIDQKFDLVSAQGHGGAEARARGRCSPASR